MTDETNPYESPPQPESKAVQPTRSDSHVLAYIVLGGITGVLAMLLTPADPLSMLAAWIPLFLTAAAAYWFGYRKGRRIRDE